MPRLHLPAGHDEDDRQLAGALAAALRSENLYVTWSRTTGHPARPVVPAAVEEPCEPRRPRRRLRGLFRKRAS